MRIAIVNDTLIAVEAILRVLATIPDYKLAWVACNGAEAVVKCAIDRPDLILMDIVMPVMDGVEATHRIMTHFPCPIVVVTTSVSAQVSKVFEAIGYGALDAVNTPILESRGQVNNGAKLLAKVALIYRLLGKSNQRKDKHLSQLQKRLIPVEKKPSLVAIGASTGGPSALRLILSQFPKNFPAAVAIVKHIDAQFAPGLVAWLNEQSSLPVQLANDGCRLEAGTVFVAGTNDHLVLSSALRFSYTPQPYDTFYRPSVDAFFKSAAERWAGNGVVVLLTGMGKDGAAGLNMLRSAGWHTIAQDRASCVVYGMPKAAVELGAAEKVLPIDAIAAAILKFIL